MSVISPPAGLHGSQVVCHPDILIWVVVHALYKRCRPFIAKQSHVVQYADNVQVLLSGKKHHLPLLVARGENALEILSVVMSSYYE